LIDMDAFKTNSTRTEFQQGDEVVLVRGSYQGTPGIFFRLKADPAWADIAERDGMIRSHPVEWLAHSYPSEARQAEAVR
jgi:hypothetical protein